MKKIILAAILFLGASFIVNAQSKSPKWVPDTGFWVVESNIHNKDKCIVFFYNHSKQLVYKENIEGKVLNIDKRKVKMRLKKVLEQTVAKFEEQHKASANEKLLANVL